MIARLGALIERFALGLCVALAACSTEATPMPEPPALDPGKLAFGANGVVPTTLAITGESGAVPAGATVRLTELDTAAPPVSGVASDTGSFLLPITGTSGELRFEVVLDGVRGPPVDVLLQAPGTLSQVTRPECVAIRPGLALPLPAAGSATLTIENRCDTELALGAPRLRRMLAELALGAPPPPALAPGQSAALSVTASAPAAAPAEDTLFVDVTVDGMLVRYPITLFRAGSP